MANWIIAVLVAGIFAVGGCNRTPKPPKTIQLNGVDVAMPQLRDALGTNSNPEVQSSLTKVSSAMRYREVPAVLAELEKLANNPALTDAQKKLVTEVTEQMKQAQSKPPAAPAQ